MLYRIVNKICGLLTVVAFLCLIPSSAKAETIGLILTHGIYEYERIHDSLVSYLKKKGHADRVKFLIQRPYPDPIALGNASRKLLVADVDIILTYGAAPTVAMLRERPRIPVLYAGVYEPIAAKITSKKTTGVCSKFNISSLVRYLRTSTTINNLGVVYYSAEKESTHQMKELQDIAKKYGFEIKPLDMKYKTDLHTMLNDVEADALMVTSSPAANSSLPTILRIATGRKIPTASLLTSDKITAMITLSSDPVRQGELLGGMLVKVLNGTPPQSIKPVCSKKIELVYNVKDANRMGLKISMDLVTEATKLINK